MSGIVGVLSLRGEPLESSFLRTLTEYMAFRGPDAQHTWVGDGIGLGHALLSVAPQANRDRQPFSLNGDLWIVADARLDGRTDLLAALQSAGQVSPAVAGDAELILHAYAAWGEGCLDRLLGDFSFAIWDGSRKSLFCARDHMGVKPFYYALGEQWLVFSNTLDCVRMQPWASAELNELSVGEFLLFGAIQDRAATIFSRIQRLPSGHSLAWYDGKLVVRPYWTPPLDEEIRYKRSADYVEHFRQLLHAAVKDRLRTARAAVSLSGGLDSTSVAAFARRAGLQDLHAVTMVYDAVIPDNERHYSGLFAKSQDIPIEYLACDRYYTSAMPDSIEVRSPQPTENALPALEADFCKLAGRNSRVLLTGEGGDVGLYPSASHFRRLLRSWRVGRFLQDGALYSIARRGLPPIGFRNWLKRRFGGRDPWQVDYPEWFNDDLESRLGLRARWHALSEPAPAPHPNRPEAFSALRAIYWQNCFEDFDPGATRACLEYVHPYFDLRLLRFLFSIPPVPWTLDKYLIRSSLRGMVPEAVRLRPKTPLAGNPLLPFVRNNRAAFSKAPKNIAPYVDLGKYQAFVESPAAFSESNYAFPLRATMLSAWQKQICGAQGN